VAAEAPGKTATAALRRTAAEDSFMMIIDSRYDVNDGVVDTKLFLCEEIVGLQQIDLAFA